MADLSWFPGLQYLGNSGSMSDFFLNQAKIEQAKQQSVAARLAAHDAEVNDYLAFPGGSGALLNILKGVNTQQSPPGASVSRPQQPGITPDQVMARLGGGQPTLPGFQYPGMPTGMIPGKAMVGGSTTGSPELDAVYTNRLRLKNPEQFLKMRQEVASNFDAMLKGGDPGGAIKYWNTSAVRFGMPPMQETGRIGDMKIITFESPDGTTNQFGYYPTTNKIEPLGVQKYADIDSNPLKYISGVKNKIDRGEPLTIDEVNRYNASAQKVKAPEVSYNQAKDIFRIQNKPMPPGFPESVGGPVSQAQGYPVNRAPTPAQGSALDTDIRKNFGDSGGVLPFKNADGSQATVDQFLSPQSKTTSLGGATSTQEVPTQFTDQEEVKLRENIQSNMEIRSAVKQLKNVANPEYQSWIKQANALWASFKDKANGLPFGGASPEQQEMLKKYTEHQYNTYKLLNDYIKNITGSQMGEKEAERIAKAIPDPSRDSPVQFATKMQSVIDQVDVAYHRAMYKLNGGLKTLQDLPLDKKSLERIMDREGDKLAQDIKANYPNISDIELGRAVKYGLSKLFGER